MPFHPQTWTKSRAEHLMDITAGVANLTQRAEDVALIPAYLSTRLDLSPLSMALVRETPAGPEIVMSAASGALAADDPSVRLVQLYHDQLPRMDGHAIALRMPNEPSEAPTVLALTESQFGKATLFARRVDVGFYMVLAVHETATSAPLSAGMQESLHAIAQQTAKFLAGIAIWLFRPEGMGAPFDRLTHREWMVLRGLSTAVGEKQLADQLKLSPHTLHSHIKSIYRKTGVQGRLPLLLHAQEALRALRRQITGTNGRTQDKAS